MKNIYLIILALLFSQLVKAQINLNEGLIGHYTFNGNTNDTSTNQNHATNYGGTFIGDGSVNDNEAIKFNGIDQYAEIENKEPFANSVYSISAYVNLNNMEEDAVIFSTFYYEQQYKYWGYNFRIRSNHKIQIANLHNSGWGVDEYIYSNTKLNSNQYYHVVVTYDGDYAKIYINSELDAIGQLPQPEFNGAIKNAYIGANHTANNVLNKFFNGVIDELRVYNRVLNQSEINKIYSEIEPIIDLEDGLKAYYPFTGDASDISGNGNDGTVSGATLIQDRIGNSDQAYSFDGNDDYINCGHDPIDSTESMSFSLWINPENNDGSGNSNSQNNEYIISSGGQTSASVGYSIFWNNGYLKLVKKTPSTKAVVDLIGPFPKNEWLHILGIFDSYEEKFKLYIQGELFTEVTSISSETLNFDYRELHIGKPNNLNNYYFKGLIDNIRLYNRVLTEKEIESLYYETCRADFKASSIIENITTPIQFSDISKSENALSNWQWDFDNDGIIDSQEQNPQYTYETTGSYDVKLIVSDGTYTDSIVKHDYIKIIDSSDGLIRHYNLDNNLQDSSGNNADATATENTFTFKNGVENSCYLTDLNSRIDVPSIGNWGNHIAISFWFYGNVSENNVALFGSRQNGSGATLTNIGCFLLSDSTLRFFVASDAVDEPNTYSSGKIKPYQWNHVVCIQNREINKNIIILNGIADSVTYTQNPRYKEYPIGFGGWNSGFSSTGNFTGRLDEIRIYNRELSAEEVAYLYNQEFAMDTDNEIIAEYEFVGNANDLSGNEYNGTVQGAELATDRFNNMGNAYQFNSSETDYIEISNDLKPDTLPIFVSTWIKQDNTSGEQVILRNDIWDATSYYAGIIIKTTDGKISAAYGDAMGNTTDNYFEKTTKEMIINENTWHHVVVGFIDTMNIAIYVDNEEVAGLYSGSITNLSYQSENGAIGIGSNETAKFSGLIDDIRIYNRYLDPLEIDEIFNSTDKYFPDLQVSTTELDFTYTIVYETSDELTFEISGNYLDGNVILKAPENFELSASSGSNFDTILTITPEYATLESTTIYSRFVPTEVSEYKGDISIHSANLSEKLISLTGNGVSSTGIQDHFTSEAIIYPNPSHGNFTIELPSDEHNMIRIFDLCGRVVFSKNYHKTDGSIHLTLNQKPGIYLIEINNEKDKYVKKIIIK